MPMWLTISILDVVSPLCYYPAFSLLNQTNWPHLVSVHHHTITPPAGFPLVTVPSFVDIGHRHSHRVRKASQR